MHCHCSRLLAGLIAIGSIGIVSGCVRPGDRLPRSGDEIVAAGQLFHTGTPVVLWLDPGGYDAYSAHRHFEPAETMPSSPAAPGNPSRFSQRFSMPAERKARVREHGWTLRDLQDQVDLFVYHYDACGASGRCFRVLQDLRGLSVQFMCDLDGTIYQTLDLKERAWHAGDVNCRCVGVEIANIGAYEDMATLNKWYALDRAGWPYCIFPPEIDVRETQLRTPNFAGRSARKQVISGRVNGRDLMQYDFTNQQYAALIKLTAAMARIFPKLKLDAPRNPDGSVRMDVLSPEELAAYSGFLGHQHTIKVKPDPGPAFDWDRVMRGARREVGQTFW